MAAEFLAQINMHLDNPTPAGPLVPVIVNPDSTFVVITYWWGGDRLNKNTQRPCPDVLLEQIKETLEEQIVEEGEGADEGSDEEVIANIFTTFNAAKKKKEAIKREGRPLTVAEKEEFNAAATARQTFLATYFNKPETKAKIAAMTEQLIEKAKAEGEWGEFLPGKGGYLAPITFQEMITRWENDCRKANCNYMAIRYTGFEAPGMYQFAINAKPLFIKRAVESCAAAFKQAGKPFTGCLYIDGDEKVRQYPVLFDTPNVDFMARGWNCDPRASSRYLGELCYDPYIFETSGGIMFFADSVPSKNLLDSWSKESLKPTNAGKADDRILSLIFTNRQMDLPIALIQLPIEYLWLNSAYTFQLPKDRAFKDVIVTHPECLTSEEAAGDQGAASNRNPTFYTNLITNRIRCEKRGGIFYERVFFEKKEHRTAFRPYLDYMGRDDVKFDNGEKMLVVVPWDAGYGEYTVTVEGNKAAAADDTAIVPTEKINGRDCVRLKTLEVLPIYKCLSQGLDVVIGDVPQVKPETDIYAINLTLPSNKTDLLTHLILDIKTKEDSDGLPKLFFCARNRIVVELISMCTTLKDINKHIETSYMFLSRIRWQFGPRPDRPSNAAAILPPPPGPERSNAAAIPPPPPPEPSNAAAIPPPPPGPERSNAAAIPPPPPGPFSSARSAAESSRFFANQLSEQARIEESLPRVRVKLGGNGFKRSMARGTRHGKRRLQKVFPNHRTTRRGERD